MKTRHNETRWHVQFPGMGPNSRSTYRLKYGTRIIDTAHGADARRTFVAQARFLNQRGAVPEPPAARMEHPDLFCK